jgi:hypothetical protein
MIKWLKSCNESQKNCFSRIEKYEKILLNAKQKINDEKKQI